VTGEENDTDVVATLVLTGSSRGRDVTAVPLPLRAPNLARACAGLQAFVSSFYPREFKVGLQQCFVADAVATRLFFGILLFYDALRPQKQWAFLNMARTTQRPPTDRQIMFASRVSGRL
jgi:hypothetical protein